MASLNRVFLAGNLTRDPEVRYTPSGTAVADLHMAINRVYTTGGEQKEETCFVGVVAWGRQAETSGEYLFKGSPLLVEGILQYDQWETESGEKRNRLRVRADRIQFLGQPKRSDDTHSSKKVHESSLSSQHPISSAGEDDSDNLPF
ncbi:MAG: single-stranded DNA-binding protein [Kiritimatiellae bacterium]|nr:single-stranded DNA-binding protein [Kiritimatiellia bacterium]